MNLASIKDGLKKARKLLKEANLLRTTNEINYRELSPSKFSNEFFQVSQDSDYRGIYKTALERRDYDFLLEDLSFLQFSCEITDNSNPTCRYAYYEAASYFPTYEEFLDELNFSYDECGDTLFEEYEQALDESRLKSSVTPMRYDYDEKLYEPPFHPVAHLHIGSGNDVRLPLSYRMPPHAFVAFVIRHAYWKQWKQLMVNDNFRDIYQVKNQCHPLDSRFFSNDEKLDFYIF